ncbi:MAG: hypothetical protein WBF67_01730, partial [Olleya sp.]
NGFSKPEKEPIVLKEKKPEPIPKPKTTSVVKIEANPINETPKQEITSSTITLKQPEVVEE